MTVDRQSVRELVVARVRAVLDVAGAEVSDATRFDEDLHADSLDLVEIVESVERELASRGVVVSVPDEQLLTLRTVGDAAARIADAADGAAAGDAPAG